MITGSSPKCSGVATSGYTPTTPSGSCSRRGTRPKPRATTPGVHPRRMRISRISITSGVLPVPPTVMLPTTITGTGARHEGRMRARYAKRRRNTASPNNTANGRKINAPPPNRCHSRSSHDLIVPDLAFGLRRERDVVVAREPRAFHHVDDRLVGRGGIGADRHHRLARSLGRVLERLREVLRAAEDRGRAVDRVLAGRVHGHAQHLRPVRGALGGGFREIDLQLGEAAVGGGEEEEDEDDDEDVDERDQVDVGILARAAAAEIHARRSPWMISTSLIAWLSMSITSTSTLLRKWR